MMVAVFLLEFFYMLLHFFKLFGSFSIFKIIIKIYPKRLQWYQYLISAKRRSIIYLIYCIYCLILVMPKKKTKFYLLIIKAKMQLSIGSKSWFTAPNRILIKLKDSNKIIYDTSGEARNINDHQSWSKLELPYGSALVLNLII